MKQNIASLLVLSMILVLCACGGAGSAPAPAPSGRIEIEPLEVGFCQEAQTGYSSSEQTITKNGVTTHKVAFQDLIYTAQDGQIHFVLRGNITNITSEPIVVDEELLGTIRFDGGEERHMRAYLYELLSGLRYNTLRAGDTSPMSIVCTVPVEYAENFKGCTMELDGITMHFGPEDIIRTQKMAFPAREDIVETSGN